MDTSSVNQPYVGVTHNMTFGVARNSTLRDQQPSLDEVLKNEAPYPYTLESFTAFMSQAHCLEILEFILEGRRYKDIYELSSVVVGTHISPARRKSRVLLELWQQLLSTYLLAGSPREINLGSNQRHGLLAYHDLEKPPAPAILDAIEQEMLDLLSASIFPSFLNEIVSTEGAATHSGAPYLDRTMSISSTVLSPYDGQMRTNPRPHVDTLGAVRARDSYISLREPATNHNTGYSSLPLDDFSRAVDRHPVRKSQKTGLSKIRTILGLRSRKE